jgi:hypothetical protein
MRRAVMSAAVAPCECGVGAPQKAITQSPMNLSTVPLVALTAEHAPEKKRFKRTLKTCG